MKSLGVTLAFTTGLFTIAVACSAPPVDSGGLDTRQGSQPKLPANGSSSGGQATSSSSSGGATSSSSSGGTTSSSGSTSSSSGATPPADCGTTANMDACFDCCASQHTAAAAQIETFFQSCFCGADACQTQCAQTACAATPAAPQQGDACDTCLAGREQTCNQQFQTNCAADPACTALLACETTAQCETKPQ